MENLNYGEIINLLSVLAISAAVADTRANVANRASTVLSRSTARMMFSAFCISVMPLIVHSMVS